MKKGLVLEGGGLRALFSEGIFDVMLEHGVTFDGAIGVSAGAAIGCNFKTRQIARGLRYNSRFAHDKRYVSLRSLLTTGDIVNRDFGYHTLPLQLDVVDAATYEANPMAFYAVCTDVDTAETVYKRLDRIDDEALEWLRASSSMPIVSQPVSIGGRRLLDGGISNSIPLQHFHDALGYERNVVILTQPKGYLKQRTRLMPLFRIFCRKIPAIVQAMSVRHEMYNAQLHYIAQQEALGTALILCPDRPLPIGRLEMKPEKMKNVYEMGRAMGLQHIGRIQTFLDGKQTPAA